MASRTINIPHAERFGEWFPDFLKKELAPYPGRGALVARPAFPLQIHRHPRLEEPRELDDD